MFCEVVYGPLRPRHAFHDSHDFQCLLGTPDESRIDFRTSQWEVSGFRRGTGTKVILAIQTVGGYDTEGLLLARIRDRL